MDIFTTFVDLLRQVGVVSKRSEGVQVGCSPTAYPVMRILSLPHCHEADTGKIMQKQPTRATRRAQTHQEAVHCIAVCFILPTLYASERDTQVLLALQATRPVDLLKADVPTIVKAAAQQLRDKSQKTKIGVFLMLRELATLLPGSISVEVARMVPGIEAALNVSWACWSAC